VTKLVGANADEPILAQLPAGLKRSATVRPAAPLIARRAALKLPFWASHASGRIVWPAQREAPKTSNRGL